MRAAAVAVVELAAEAAGALPTRTVFPELDCKTMKPAEHERQSAPTTPWAPIAAALE